MVQAWELGYELGCRPGNPCLSITKNEGVDEVHVHIHTPS